MNENINAINAEAILVEPEEIMPTPCLKYGEVEGLRILLRQERKEWDRSVERTERHLKKLVEEFEAAGDVESIEKTVTAYHKAKDIYEGKSRRQRAKLQPVRRLAKHELFEMAYEEE